jgi:predicted transcriptional regulator
MHVHACQHELMRTTIEIKPDHRARILELAASRGEKGFSTVVADALDMYLEAQEGRADAIRKALRLKGSISQAEADTLASETRRLRSTWR